MSLACEALLFDLDGVLVDSEVVIERAWRRWAEEHDIPFDEVREVYHGRPMKEVIEEVAPHLDAQAEADQGVEYAAADLDGLTAFDGAVSLLEGVPDARWAIATSGRYRTATARLAHTDLPRPDVLVTADDIEEGKPAPEPYERAAEQLGVAPDRCVVFEDAPAGVEAGHRAGARVIGVATTSSPEALSAADAVVASVADVTVRVEGNGALRVTWDA